MPQNMLLYVFLFAISIFLIALSILAIYGVSIVLRESGLGSLFESFKAFFIARRLKLRYKGSSVYKVARNGESGTVTYTHNKRGCNAFLYRGIVSGEGLSCKGSSLELGVSVLYCPKCETIVCQISEADAPNPREEEKRGPLGIVK